MANSDREFYQLNQSIHKALLGYETPLKEKHARQTVISTFKYQGAKVFWTLARNQPIMENQISAWKFCHLLHKVLSDGHNLCASHSVQELHWIDSFGKLWGHLTGGYGLCILQYTKLLRTKIEFHHRNPRFPGNLHMEKEEVNSIAHTSPDDLFQLTIEVFDFLDQLIGLQATVNNSLSEYRISSMTNAGQCRIAALIPCIQDSYNLYDIAVRFMFRLYANIPSDMLIGHTKRFTTIYHQLSSFYGQAREYQYFQHFITVPELPKQIPNFAEVSTSQDYCTPSQIISKEVEPEVEEIIEPDDKLPPAYDENLVDTSFDMSKNGAVALEEKPIQPSAYFEELIRERDDLISSLQNEMSSMRGYIAQVQTDKSNQHTDLQNQLSSLSQKFVQRDEEVKKLVQEKGELQTTVQSVTALEKKLAAEGEKSKAMEEKFTKLKDLYTQIRDEHVKLLRQHQETSKKLTESTKSYSEAEQTRQSIEAQLREIELEKSMTQEQLQQSAQDKESEKQQLLDEIESVKEMHQTLKKEYEEAEIKTTDQLADLGKIIHELKSEIENQTVSIKKFEDEKQELQDEVTALSKAKFDLENRHQQTLIVVEERQTENAALQTKGAELESELTTTIFELRENIDSLKVELESEKSISFQLDNEKKDLSERIGLLEMDRQDLKLKCQRNEEEIEKQREVIEERQQQYDRLVEDKGGIAQEMNETKIKLEEVTTKNSDLSDQYNELQNEKLRLEDEYKTQCEEDLKRFDEMKEELSEKLQLATTTTESLIQQKEECLLEINDLKTQLTEKIDECVRLQGDSEATIVTKDKEIEGLQAKVRETEEKYQRLCENMERDVCRRNELESEIYDLLHQQEEIEQRNQEAQEKIAHLEESLKSAKIHTETSVRTLMEACIKSSESIAAKPLADSEINGAIGTPSYFLMVSEELKDVLAKLEIVYGKYLEDNSCVEGLARKVIMAGHLFATVHVQGLVICNSSADIERGEQSAEHLTEWSQSGTNLIHSLLTNTGVDTNLQSVQSKLNEIITEIGNLTKKSESSEQISDLIEEELLGMDKSIEEAAAKIAEMLSKARETDSGIKLEVNEKILDTCTTLMKAIRELVKKSRILQAEIVATGKGTASVKEFYKRNHQWTEGMISAAKNVAQGANFLVTAANKAITGEAKDQFYLVGAAKEIAASTAQLVVASRVKAQRGSVNLVALSEQSKKVTQAMGAVVATAKDSRQRLEDSQDLDLSSLTVHQAKKLEMEIQVKLLELEQSLETERLKLAAFRRQNYSNVD